jgi:8-oxo-dGTP pyrophosphatase MutT (NUDIX family)
VAGREELASQALDISAIEARLATFDRLAAAPGAGRQAAVAIALAPSAAGSQFVLTIRSSTLRSHAGQYALPGGHVDPGESATDTAVREVAEEVGLHPGRWRSSYLLDDYVTASGRVVTPVALLSDEPIDSLVPNPAEVAEAFVVEVGDLGLDDPTVRVRGTGPPVTGLHVGCRVLFAPTGAILLQFRDIARHGRTTRNGHIREPFFARQ